MSRIHYKGTENFRFTRPPGKDSDNRKVGITMNAKVAVLLLLAAGAVVAGISILAQTPALI